MNAAHANAVTPTVIPRIFESGDINLGEIRTLTALNARHLTKVLRLRPGATVILFNGQGGEYQAVVEQANARGTRVRVESFDDVDRESSFGITLVQGISRGDRMDYALQKAVELGVQTIIPMLTKRCVVKLDAERATKRLEHWQGVIKHAMEQSGRTAAVRIEPIQTLDAIVERARSLPQQAHFVLDPTADLTPANLTMAGLTCTIAAGPEGGFEQAERDLLVAADFRALKIGPRVLRTETAALAAIAALQTRFGDFS